MLSIGNMDETWPKGADKTFMYLWRTPFDLADMCEQWITSCEALGRNIETVKLNRNRQAILNSLEQTKTVVSEFVLFCFEEMGEGVLPAYVTMDADAIHSKELKILHNPDRISRNTLNEFVDYRENRNAVVSDKIARDFGRFRKVLSEGDYELWLSRADMQPACRMHFVKMLMDKYDLFGELLTEIVDEYCLKALSMFRVERQWSKDLGIETANWVLKECRRRHNATTD